MCHLSQCDFLPPCSIVNHCFLGSLPRLRLLVMISLTESCSLFKRTTEFNSRTRCVALYSYVPLFFIIPQLNILEWKSFPCLLKFIWHDIANYFDSNKVICSNNLKIISINDSYRWYFLNTCFSDSPIACLWNFEYLIKILFNLLIKNYHSISICELFNTFD